MQDNFYADPEICQAVLMDYYRNPRCAGVCGTATHHGAAQNPACGDQVSLTFHVADDCILQARTEGAGCAVSQASASLLMEQLEGRGVDEAHAILHGMGRLLEGKEDGPGELGRLEALSFIVSHPARVRCANVAREAALKALSGSLDR